MDYWPNGLEYINEYKYFDIDNILIGDILDKGNIPVYKGKLNGKDIAIKEYTVDDEEYLYLDDSIITELRIGLKADSKRLLKVYGYSHSKDKMKYYLLMEYINKGSIFNYINDYFVNIIYKGQDTDKKSVSNYNLISGKSVWNYTMSEKQKYSIAISIIKSIISMYRNNIIHGDLKSANLVVHKEDNNIYVKVIDYGTCYHVDDRDKNVDLDRVIGTSGFYAPEQEDNILNHKSDIYSIGVTIIEVWTGTVFMKHSDKFNEARNEVLKSLRIIKNNNKELEKILRKSIDLNYKKRPNIYQLYDMFIELDVK
uniref:non-specific serine/threonine protein kinase n=1 Tax=viral metagenome TaxID=1070528 RepID=A0A6C0C6N1_9ZZZZ